MPKLDNRPNIFPSISPTPNRSDCSEVVPSFGPLASAHGSLLRLTPVRRRAGCCSGNLKSNWQTKSLSRPLADTYGRRVPFQLRTTQMDRVVQRQSPICTPVLNFCSSPPPSPSTWTRNCERTVSPIRVPQRDSSGQNLARQFPTLVIGISLPVSNPPTVRVSIIVVFTRAASRSRSFHVSQSVRRSDTFTSLDQMKRAERESALLTYKNSSVLDGNPACGAIEFTAVAPRRRPEVEDLVRTRLKYYGNPYDRLKVVISVAQRRPGSLDTIDLPQIDAPRWQ